MWRFRNELREARARRGGVGDITEGEGPADDREDEDHYDEVAEADGRRRVRSSSSGWGSTPNAAQREGFHGLAYFLVNLFTVTWATAFPSFATLAMILWVCAVGVCYVGQRWYFRLVVRGGVPLLLLLASLTLVALYVANIGMPPVAIVVPASYNAVSCFVLPPRWSQGTIHTC